MRILNALGWNTFDTNIVMSEYSLRNGRVDFALTRKKDANPSVFIEVKQPGKAENADEQLFKYAFDEGVPFAILTDGKTWNFYLPSAQGKFADRRIYKLDLQERAPEESEEKLKRYLEFERVKSGQALDDALKDYRSKFKADEARNAIPDVWEELVDSKDEMLFEILADAVEKKCGYKPKDTDIADFLSKIRFVKQDNTQPEICDKAKKNRNSTIDSSQHKIGSWYSINGIVYNVSSAKQVVVDLLNYLYRTDNSLFEKCLKHKLNYGRNRQYIALKKSDLYKNRPDYADKCEKLKGNVYLGTNFNNSIKEKILSMVFEIEGIKKGKEIDYTL